jgi:hypothetical protein
VLAALAKHFGFAHNFWRSPPRGPGIGWLELLAWIKAMKRQREVPQPSPDSWDVRDPWFDEQRKLRQEQRGY